MMNLEQIKAAVLAGKVVHWANDGYVVEVDRIGQWYIVCTDNNNAIGLTWMDEITMNGKPEEFYISEQ